MAITRRMRELGFPMNLTVVPTNHEDVRPMLLQWAEPHNRVVRAFDIEHRNPGTHPHLKDCERGILGLAAGIESWLTKSGHADDGVLGRKVTYPLLNAFRAALDGETGRLDCGTLCNWAEDRLRELGINPDTGEWLTLCRNCKQSIFKDGGDVWKHEHSGEDRCNPNQVTDTATATPE